MMKILIRLVRLFNREKEDLNLRFWRIKLWPRRLLKDKKIENKECGNNLNKLRINNNNLLRAL